MTPKQQRIKIAEACGWTDTEIINKGGKIMYGQTEVADYLNDLNAMHEAEKVLLGMCDNDPQADLWISYLADLVLAAPCCLREHATAAQRAEAFLKTLDLWEE